MTSSDAETDSKPIIIIIYYYAQSLADYRFWGTKKPDDVVELPVYYSKIIRLNSANDVMKQYC